jgi:N-acetylneuraminate synthase
VLTISPILHLLPTPGPPVMLSTGLRPCPDIEAAVAGVRRGAAPLAILQCATQYPSPPEMIGLNLIAEFRDRYKTAVGLSDHSGTIYPGIAAATFGIEVLEIHITMSREMFGPDVVASVTSEELRQLVDGVRFVEAMAAHPVDKTTVADHVAPLRDIFLKSVVPLADLAAGTVLQRDHLGFKKPGTGIPASEYESVVGQKLSRNVKRDVPLVREDLETH